MGFKLERNGFQHRIGEAGIKISSRMEQSPAMVSWLEYRTWEINGRLRNDTGDPKDCDALVDAIKDLYSVDGGYVKLLHEDDTPTCYDILDGDTIGGIIIKQPPSFMEYKGAEHVFFRSYSIVLEAAFLTDNENPGGLLEWNEQLSFTGGLPEKVFLVPNTGAPIEQLGKEQTPYEATQSGTIVGLMDYPVLPTEIWPSAIMTKRTNVRPPRYFGAGGANQMLGYPIDYTYTFKSVTELTGTPGTIY